MLGALGVVVMIPSLVGFRWVSDGLLSYAANSVLVTVLDLSLALIVAGALAARSAISTGLSLRPLRVLGMACYSLYLWHMPIQIALRLHIDPWNALNLMAFTIMLFALAGMSYRFIEFRRIADWRSLFLLRGSDEGLRISTN